MFVVSDMRVVDSVLGMRELYVVSMDALLARERAGGAPMALD